MEINDYKLKHISIFIRHGDRTPLSSKIGKNLYMNDKEKEYWMNSLPSIHETSKLYDYTQIIDIDKQKDKEILNNNPENQYIHEFNDSSSKWPNGQLTRKGALQMISNGTKIKNEYNPFILQQKKMKFSTQESVYIRSTNFRRTVESVQYFLKGLFPEIFHDDNCKDNKINNDTPPFYIKIKTSITLAPAHSFMRNPVIQNKLVIENNELIKLEKTVKEIVGISSISKVRWAAVRGVLVCRQSHNLTMPTGITNEIFNRIHLLTALHWHNMYSDLKACRSGFSDVIIEIYELFSEIINGKSNYMLSIFSCHDTSILALLHALQLEGMEELHLPNYGAMIVFELYENIKENCYFIRIKYQDSFLGFKQSHPSNLNDSLYSFTNFKSAVESFLGIKTDLYDSN